MKCFDSTFSLGWLLTMSPTGAQHLGISTTHRDATMQHVMATRIRELTQSNGNGSYPILDPESRSLVQLQFERLHDSIEVKGGTSPCFVRLAECVARDGTAHGVDVFISENYEVALAPCTRRTEQQPATAWIERVRTSMGRLPA